jgi:hypothetical protein
MKFVYKNKNSVYFYYQDELNHLFVFIAMISLFIKLFYIKSKYEMRFIWWYIYFEQHI